MTDTFTSLHLGIKNLVSLMSPLIGGALYDHYGYETALDTCWMITGCLCLLNIMFNMGCSPYKERAREVETLEQLKEIGDFAKQIAEGKQKHA